MQPELPRIADAPRGRRTPMAYLRPFGALVVVAYVIGSLLGDPPASLHGEGLAVLACVAVLVVCFPLAMRLSPLPPGRRFAALLGVGAASIALILLEGAKSSGIVGLYFAAVLAAVRLPWRQALVVAGFSVIGGALAYAATGPDADGQVISVLVGIPPWFLVIRSLRELRERQVAAEALVEELQESRAAQAEAAALAERSRVARDMHDVLAHSLSALALQLEGARLLARDRGADPDVVAAIERAHHLTSSGLDEARRAIAALRGEEIPGPQRLQALADAFADHSSADCSVRVEGTPRPLASEAGLAIYRTAQEALTNIRKHAAAERVEVVLRYADGGTTLQVEDHGPGAPVTVGGGSGYGLTGMRERAELLGGRLEAAPTADGFRVELWLPA
jgi:signal transduction histidine kinase